MSKITKINSERPVAENLQHQLFQLSDIQGIKSWTFLFQKRYFFRWWVVVANQNNS